MFWFFDETPPGPNQGPGQQFSQNPGGIHEKTSNNLDWSMKKKLPNNATIFYNFSIFVQLLSTISPDKIERQRIVLS